MNPAPVRRAPFPAARAIALIAVLVCAPSADASRTMAIQRAVTLEHAAPRADILQGLPADPEPRFRLFADLDIFDRATRLVGPAGQRASGSTSGSWAV